MYFASTFFLLGFISAVISVFRFPRLAAKLVRVLQAYHEFEIKTEVKPKGPEAATGPQAECSDALRKMGMSSKDAGRLTSTTMATFTHEPTADELIIAALKLHGSQLKTKEILQ